MRDSRRHWLSGRELPRSDLQIDSATTKCAALLDEIDRLVLDIDLPSESVINFERISKSAAEAEAALADLEERLLDMPEPDDARKDAPARRISRRVEAGSLSR